MTPSRSDAWALLCEFTQSDALRKHARAVEEAMRAYARWFGVTDVAEIEKWGIVGMLHDFAVREVSAFSNRFDRIILVAFGSDVYAALERALRASHPHGG